MFNSFEDFKQAAKSHKQRKRLHTITQQRLKELLLRLYPDSHVVSEVTGVLGGRNDLMQFLYSSRRVVFEMFFSPSQVSQDLRLLEQSQADVKIAILLDREIDGGKLADEYFHKKPDSFPFLWLSQVLMPDHEAVCLTQLKNQIAVDENRPAGIGDTPIKIAVEPLEQPLRSDDKWVSLKVVNNHNDDITDCFGNLARVVFLLPDGAETEFNDSARLAWSANYPSLPDGRLDIPRGTQALLDVARTKQRESRFAFTLQRGDDPKTAGRYKVQIQIGGKVAGRSFSPVVFDGYVEYRGGLSLVFSGSTS